VLPLGSVQPIKVNVRIIAATHRNLEELVRAGKFRADLFFRLNVVKLEVPPLRQRRGDVVALADAFLAEQAQLYQEAPRSLSSDAVAALLAYDWPGNVRELANAIEHACALSSNTVLTADDLPDVVRSASAPSPAANDELILPLHAAERLLIARALDATGGNQAKAAQLLQIERHRLSRKIRHHRLEAFARPQRI
jgi:DNA-binding NtrC family response regulator